MKLSRRKEVLKFEEDWDELKKSSFNRQSGKNLTGQKKERT